MSAQFHARKCPRCDGLGWIGGGEELPRQTCHVCLGAKRIASVPDQGHAQMVSHVQFFNGDVILSRMILALWGMARYRTLNAMLEIENAAFFFWSDFSYTCGGCNVR